MNALIESANFSMIKPMLLPPIRDRKKIIATRLAFFSNPADNSQLTAAKAELW
ncbi:hypothetical protein [Methylomicrobium lacus]|uniref:hypothetical protein n=1 Tax=Methylomicrobium lacus TaxID=136992 RepID=UPI0013768767|nr:hypothetical protein [Methylomicrobium lacus]